MTTENQTPAAATPDQGSQPNQAANPNTTPSQAANPAADGGGQQDTKPADAGAKPADTKSADKKQDAGDLLFGKKDGDAKPATADEMRAFLKEKGTEDKDLEGKNDEELKKLFDEAKAKDGDSAQTFKFEELKIPEEMQVSDEMKGKVGELANIFKDSKLSDTQKMQKAIDLHVETQQKTLEFWQETKAEWRKQVEEDKEIGGQNLKPTVQRVEALIQKFGGTPDQIKEMQDDLLLLGLGNKRSFIRFCNNIAKATSEDSMDGTAVNNKAPDKSLAQMMYPNMP